MTRTLENAVGRVLGQRHNTMLTTRTGHTHKHSHARTHTHLAALPADHDPAERSTQSPRVAPQHDPPLLSHFVSCFRFQVLLTRTFEQSSRTVPDKSTMRTVQSAILWSTNHISCVHDEVSQEVLMQRLQSFDADACFEKLLSFQADPDHAYWGCDHFTSVERNAPTSKSLTCKDH